MVQESFTMADDKVSIFSDSTLPVNAFKQLEEIRRHGKLCDITLRVGENKYSAHRIVLAATIPYFQAMFTHDMIESKLEEVNMQGIEASALELLINFAYSGQVQISDENVQALLIGAGFLNLNAVKEACCKFLIERIRSQNVIAVRSFGKQMMESTIVNAAETYINNNFTRVSNTRDFLDLSFDDLQDILRRDELNVTSEEPAFEAVIRWIKSSPELRLQYLPSLISHVRLPLMTPQYLADVVGANEFIKSSLPCRDLLDEAKDFHLMPDRRHSLKTFKIQHRGTIGVEYVIAVGGLTSCGDSVSTVEIYNPLENKWSLASSMKTLRSRVGVAVLNGKLYAIGGYNGVERLDTVEVFDPAEAKWRAVAPLTCPRSALGAAPLADKLYVCGGFDGLTSLDTVECFCPKANKWSAAARMKRPRSAAGIVSLDKHIYAIGGHDGLSIFESVERFDMSTETWEQVIPMQTRRCRLGAAALNGKLYVAGGYDGQRFLKTCECYDPVTGRWSFISPMTVPRSRVALVASCRKLYAIGGYDGQHNLTCVEIYDPLNDTWTMAAPMAAHEGGVGVGVVRQSLNSGRT